MLSDIARQRCQRAKQRYEVAKQRYQEAKHRYREATWRCTQAKQRYKETKRRCDEAMQRCKEGGHKCERCGADNSIWEELRMSEPVEQEGWRGIIAFTKPHCCLPFVITVLSTLLGLLAFFTLWANIKPYFRVLALLMTASGCLLSLQGVYTARLKIRQKELLRRVKRGWRRGISTQVLALLLPAGAVGTVLILTYALIRIGDLWELVKWLALISAPDMGDGLPKKVVAVLPFVSLIGCVVLAICFTASSSLLLTLRYIKRLNELLPHPLFLQGERLAQVVRREAEVELGRLDPRSTDVENTNASWMGYIQLREQASPRPLRLPPTVDMSIAAEIPSSPQVELWIHAATWVWDELKRTDDGGIEMKVARHEIYQLPKPTDHSSHRPHPRVCYVVRADPWGHIVRIQRDDKQTK